MPRKCKNITFAPPSKQWFHTEELEAYLERLEAYFPADYPDVVHMAVRAGLEGVRLVLAQGDSAASWQSRTSMEPKSTAVRCCRCCSPCCAYPPPPSHTHTHANMM
jgi:hypothetical protein